MEKIVVVGGGKHAKSVITAIKKNNKYNLVGYIDLKDRGIIQGVPYLGNDDMLEKLYVKDNVQNLAFGIGMIKNFEFVTDFVDRLKQIGYCMPTIISPLILKILLSMLF